MTKEKEKLINNVINSRFVGLEEIFLLLDCKKPFKKNGELTITGDDARRTLVAIVEGLECIGAVKVLNGNFEDYLDSIIDEN